MDSVGKVLILSRAVGAASAAVGAAGYLLLYANPYSSHRPTGFAVDTMIALHIVAAIAAAVRTPVVVLYGLFVVMFVPMGIYMSGTPSVFAFIGVADLLFVVAVVARHWFGGRVPRTNR